MYNTVKKIKKTFELVKKTHVSLSCLKDYDPTVENNKDMLEMEGEKLWKVMGEEIIADIKLKISKQFDKSQNAILKRFYEDNFNLTSIYRDLSKVSVINS
jgi:regulator of replication initiation timing